MDVNDFSEIQTEEAEFPPFDSELLTAEVGVVDPGFFRKPRNELIYHLGDWEGPIALLYELIVESNIDIRELVLSKVVGQYCDIILGADDINADYAADFVVIGSKLLLFKSRRLFPDTELSEEELDEETDLFTRIEEYKLLREATEKLRDKETIYRFYREPSYTKEDYVYSFRNMVMEKLAEAYAKALIEEEHRRALETAAVKTVYKEAHTVADRYNYIYNRLCEIRSMSFYAMFAEEDLSKEEIVNTFLAILELLKRQFVNAEQNPETKDIYLTLKESGEMFVEAKSEKELLDVEINGTN